MKKTVTLILFQFIGYWCMAQITLQSLLPETGMFQKSQLWNMVVVNSSSTSASCYIVLSLQDRNSGTEVLSATSAGFTLDKGAKQLNDAVLTPIQYTYFSFSGDKTDDFLPVGNYTACFKLIGQEGADLAEACTPFDVAPLSPPVLIFPADSAVLQAAPTSFSWQAPAPLVMFQQLHYEIMMAEILPGQKPEEAIELNAPFYMDLNVTGSFLNYTGAYPSFEKGKWYAWQVVAQDGQNYAAKTPVWDFSISTNPPATQQPVDISYVKLNRENEAGLSVCNDVLRYEYDNQVNDKIVNYTITDLSKGKNEVIDKGTVKLKPGTNYIDLPLSKQLAKNTQYRFLLTNSRGENWNVKFIISNQNK